jgi:hypothetical protein
MARKNVEMEDTVCMKRGKLMKLNGRGYER